MTSGFIVSLFQSREVSCLEVHVNETKTKSSCKSEVADLNCLSLLFCAMGNAAESREIFGLL